MCGARPCSTCLPKGLRPQGPRSPEAVSNSGLTYIMPWSPATMSPSSLHSVLIHLFRRRRGRLHLNSSVSAFCTILRVSHPVIMLWETRQADAAWPAYLSFGSVICTVAVVQGRGHETDLLTCVPAQACIGLAQGQQRSFPICYCGCSVWVCACCSYVMSAQVRQPPGLFGKTRHCSL